jgi:hypothetical protein
MFSMTYGRVLQKNSEGAVITNVIIKLALEALPTLQNGEPLRALLIGAKCQFWREMAVLPPSESRYTARRNSPENFPRKSPRKADGVVISRIVQPFSHALQEVGNRMLIEDTCKECGASKLVSIFDGSLEEWEEQHSETHESEEEN